MKLRTFIAPVIAALALALSACGGASDTANAATPHGDGGSAVTTVSLRNGVPCYVMDGQGAGLQCDWQAPRGPVSDQDPEGDNGTSIPLVTLRNGVSCAGMVSRSGDSQHKALSCDWLGQRGPATDQDPQIGGTAVTLVRFPDGTECAVMDGRGKTLSCSPRHAA